MLTPKKISKKKMAMYIATIAAMAGGTLFMLAQNYWLTAKKAPVIDIPAELGSLSRVSSDSNATPAKTTAASESQVATSTSRGTASLAESNTIIDISLFSDKKYQALKDNRQASSSLSEAIGKRNPFEAYK